ncbi:MAG TPA: Wzz/FepE/Etk N-terminal domain-containing protein [Mucilaginibacter sp.]
MVKPGTDIKNEVTLKDVILRFIELKKFLRSKWKTILIFTLIGSALGVTYSLIKKPMYVAELSFALDDDKSGGTGLGAAAGLASQFGIDLGGASGGGAFSGDNLQELMKSRTMVEKTLLVPVTVNNKQQTLAQYYIDFTEFHKKKPDLKNINYPVNLDRSHFTLQQDSVLGVFYTTITKANLSVDKVDKKLSIITVKVTSENEMFSKMFTEMLVKNVSDFYIETKTKKSARNVAILQHQTDSVRNALNNAITGAAATSDVNPNPNPSLQIIRVPSLRKQVDVQANTAILTELVKNLELSKMSLRRETPLVQVIDRPILPLEKQRFGKLKGIVIFGFVFGFFTVLYLLLKKLLRDSLN